MRWPSVLVALFASLGCGRSMLGSELQQEASTEPPEGQSADAPSVEGSPDAGGSSVVDASVPVVDSATEAVDGPPEAVAPPPYDAGAACLATCSGCCEGTTCFPGGADDPLACGVEGGACITCPQSYACADGRCYPPKCTPPNCSPGMVDM